MIITCENGGPTPFIQVVNPMTLSNDSELSNESEYVLTTIPRATVLLFVFDANGPILVYTPRTFSYFLYLHTHGNVLEKNACAT